MFERFKEWREGYSQSSRYHKDETLRPLYVKMGRKYLTDAIVNILKDLKYKEIVVNDYNEIFTQKAGYEVTITLIAGQSSSTTIMVGVFSPKNRGKTRKALRFLLYRFKEELKPYLSDE